MKKNCFLYCFTCIICFPGISQLQQVYSFQKDDTILKRKYFEQSSRTKEFLIGAGNIRYAKDYKDIYDKQFKEIFDLLETTRSVTAPEAHEYLQSVLQKIINANSELKGTDVRVIFSRDWWPNAYSMGDGTIAVNAGLVIFLNNEAELVFVLCHELAHYYLQHTPKAIKNYVETINSESFQAELKRLSKEEFGVGRQVEQLEKSLAFDSRRHSRSNEAEADLQGFNFMKKTGYDCSAIKSCLQILDRIDDSSLYQPLNVEQAFNFKDYPFKKKWIEKESAIFSQLDESDSPLSQKEKDSLKTHPDCSKRILLLSDSLKTVDSSRNFFLVSENVFNKLKKDFFIEMTEQCYHVDNLSRNLYYSLLLLQANENVPVAVYSVARCLNQVYEKQKNHRLGLMIDLENKQFSADYNLLLRMLNRLKLDEIATLNYQFCKKYYEQMENYPVFREEVRKLPKLK
jgi:Zn-dependent protease with chaperone function